MCICTYVRMYIIKYNKISKERHLHEHTCTHTVHTERLLNIIHMRQHVIKTNKHHLILYPSIYVYIYLPKG